MNEMFRRPDQSPLRPGDVIRTGHEDWNNRINRAISSETAWKRTAWFALTLVTASGVFNVWQAGQTHIQVVHVVHDKVGNVITVQTEGNGISKPTPAMIAAALKDWIINVRTVGVDVNAMRRAIPAAFNLVASGSQARTTLALFFQGNDPFKRATLETVNVSDPVAIPPPPATLGKDDLQTWRVQWTEQVIGRDGIVRSTTNWFLTVTFTVTLPKSKQEVDDDPDGISIASFSWTQQ